MKNLFIPIFALFFLAFVNPVLSQTKAVKVTNSSSKVDWYTFEEVIELQKTAPRKIFIDVYTDWCGWCKKMDKATFQHKDIAKYLNENYYSIKFDAEQKEPITLGGKSYKFVPQGRRGYHELAAEITKGKLSFPTIVFLNENMELIQPMSGFKDPKTFEMIMTFFSENHHKKTPWSVYQKKYKSFIND